VTLIATGAALLLFQLPGPWTVMLWTVPMFAICNGLAQSNFMALISRSAPDTIQGEILGINASVAALAQALPPILSGVIAASMNPSFTMAVAAGIVICSGVIFLMSVLPERAQSNA
jgi:predicted MFS family arabinose efflux permease